MAQDSVKIKMYSAYNHLHDYWDEDGIPFYNDKYVMSEIRPGAMALLIEPRSLLPMVYEYVEQHYDKFVYVFTHDSILLKKLPNAKLIIWGGVWSWGDEDKDFKHPISLVASDKGGSQVRIERRNMAFEFKLNPFVDTYGTFDGGSKVSTDTIYGKYPFSIVVENHIDDYWITEKICNCFSHKTIPIYYGARKVDELFNSKGILHAYSIDEVKQWTTTLLRSDCRRIYNSRLDAIEDNYVRVKDYNNFNVWFIRKYGELLKTL